MTSGKIEATVKICCVYMPTQLFCLISVLFKLCLSTRMQFDLFFFYHQKLIELNTLNLLKEIM